MLREVLREAIPDRHYFWNHMRPRRAAGFHRQSRLTGAGALNSSIRRLRCAAITPRLATEHDA